MSGCSHSHAADATGKTVVFNLTVNLLLTAGKWLAFALTGSPSIFGEATHSTADSINPILLWIGHRKGQERPCHDHPLGHGRETFFWSLIAALLMLVGGACLTAWHGINTLVSGETPGYSPLSLGIMGIALLAEGITFTLAWRRLKQERGHGLFDRLRRSHNSVILGVLMENGVDAIGVILGFSGYALFALTGNPVWDAVFSLCIAATLAASSLFLVMKNRSLLTGETSPDHERLAATAVQRRPAVAEVQAVQVIVIGPSSFHCRLKLRLHANWMLVASLEGKRPIHRRAIDLIREMQAIEAAVRQAVPEVNWVDIKIVS